MAELEGRGVDTAELAFLASTASRRSWPQFLDFVEREVDGNADQLAEVVSGAVKGFAFARVWLCPATVEA